MKTLLLAIICCAFSAAAYCQSPAVDIYDLVKKFLYDSTGYENIGDWAVGNPKKYAVKWKADRIEVSNDTSINFYRQGTADILVKGKRAMQGTQPVQWNIMLKGPRMGYGSVSILSGNSVDFKPAYNIDSLFGKKNYRARLLSSCDRKMAGFYYYELKLPKKDLAYLKLSWLTANGSTALRIDLYDSYSRYAAKLDCPK
ncbi:MAG: hypothetical protein EOO06_13695 [Chitinophagaceae bacterium]|nr:MAG: hypothetical protein EOO06_13695 [Chitinophagaceae bacterium]